MTAPREAILKTVRLWLEYAEDDLRLAEYAMTMPAPRPYRLIAYHAQQCTEKYLKAYLVWCEVDFPFTHNISTLLELCQPMATWPAELTEAEQLTAYAITARYPGVEQAVDKAEVESLLEITRRLRHIVRKTLVCKGLDLQNQP